MGGRARKQEGQLCASGALPIVRALRKGHVGVLLLRRLQAVCKGLIEIGGGTERVLD